MSEGTSSPAPATQRQASRGWITLLPLAVFVGLGILFGARLFSGSDPSALPSTLIAKPVPVFDLPAVEGLEEGKIRGFKDADLKAGGVTIVNFFASWCPPCREEHPQLLELAKDGRIKIYGVNTKDAPADARRFLATNGNPFAAIGADRSGRAAIDWGCYGAPETFLIKGDGTVIYKQIGAITPDVLAKVIRPRIEQALAGG